MSCMQALHALCALTERDVRACLSTLQLLARRHARVQAHHVEGVALGHKDITRSIFTMWQALLTGSVRPVHCMSELSSLTCTLSPGRCLTRVGSMQLCAQGCHV